jgi:hypothetical protein
MIPEGERGVPLARGIGLAHHRPGAGSAPVTLDTGIEFLNRSSCSALACFVFEPSFPNGSGGFSIAGNGDDSRRSVA